MDRPVDRGDCARNALAVRGPCGHGCDGRDRADGTLNMACGAVGHGPRDANADGSAPCEGGSGIEPAPAGYLQTSLSWIDAGALAGVGRGIDRREAACLLARAAWSPRAFLRSLAGGPAYGRRWGCGCPPRLPARAGTRGAWLRRGCNPPLPLARGLRMGMRSPACAVPAAKALRGRPGCDRASIRLHQ